MGKNTVFNAGAVKKASEQSANIKGLKKRASGPALENSLFNRFASVNFEKIKRSFNKEYRIPEIQLVSQEQEPSNSEELVDMDSVISSALAQHEKRMKQNFLFDRIRAISSETRRINANIELDNTPS